MTYLNFLILFVITPAVVLGFLFRRRLSKRWWGYIALLALIAVIWTTPWDNYLVANGVWWYDPQLVLGVVIGYVPLEEYSFFVLQTLLTGILLAGLSGTGWAKPRHSSSLPFYVRLIPSFLLAVMVIAMLLTHDPQYSYLILTLGWLGLLPLTIQWLFGLDILLRYWRVLVPAVLVPTLWLTLMDSIAIGAGTWTINPAQTVGIFLPGGVVPLEEGVFFLLTNALIVQGLLLVSAPASLARLSAWRDGLLFTFRPSLAPGEKSPNVR